MDKINKKGVIYMDEIKIVFSALSDFEKKQLTKALDKQDYDEYKRLFELGVQRVKRTKKLMAF
jgi:hypothetical protein